MDALDSKDRLQIIEKLIQYCIPKQQTISIEAQIQAEYAAIESLIDKLPEKAIDEIKSATGNKIEGGYTVKWNMEAVKLFYGSLCVVLGTQNQL